MTFALALLLTGCPTTDTATGDSPTKTDTGGTATTFEGETAGDCAVTAGDAVPYDTVYAGNVSGGPYPGTVEAYTFETEAEWTTFLAEVVPGGTVAPVDFATHRVVAVLVTVNNTCSLTVGDVSVTQVTGEPVHADLSIEDGSGGCDTACAAIGQALVAVAIARDDAGAPTVCARRADVGCR